MTNAPAERPAASRPEHVPTVDRVNAYLAGRGHAGLCADVEGCDPRTAEALLADDLSRLVRNRPPLPPADRAELRLYLRAVSWFRYPPPTDQELLALADGLPGLTAEDRALFHGALADHVQGDTLEPAAQRVDALFLEAWERSQDAPAAAIEGPPALERLRPLRDAIYFRRHLSHWLSWSGQAAETNKRPE